ncbi:MAG: helix-turn-helix domain-containing protein [Saprospiraceae bacterium]
MRLWQLLFLVFNARWALYAQLATGSPGGLPALLPAATDTLSNSRDFPNKCFDAAFTGPRGRLFLRSCATANQRQEIYLVQFDGYDFHPLEIQIPESPGWSQQRPRLSHQHTPDLLIGHYANALLLYDLRSHESRLLPIDSVAGPGKIILQTVAGDPGETWVLAKDSTQLYMFRYTDDHFLQVTALPLQDMGFEEGVFFSPSLICYDQGIVWFTDSKRQIVRMDAKTGVCTRFFLDLPVLQKTDEHDFIIRNLTVHRNTVYCTVLEAQKTTLLQWGPNATQFTPTRHTSPANFLCKLFTDQTGNLVILWESKTGTPQAFLIDASGKKFDYTPILAPLVANTIMELDGRDFRKQVLVLTKSGLFNISLHQPENIQTYFPNRSIRGMIEMPSGELLVAVDKEPAFRQLTDPEMPALPNRLVGQPVWKGQRFLPDGKFIWYVSNGPFNTVFRFNVQDQQIDSFKFDFRINRLAVLANQTLALVSLPHLYIYDIKTGRLDQYQEDGRPKIFDFGKQVHDIIVGRDKTLWVGSNGGLWKVDLFRQKSRQFSRQAGLNDHRVQVVCESRNGTIWFGTILGGLHVYNPKTGQLQVIDRAEGLANNTVVSILEDNDGFIWVGTYDGLSLLDPSGRVLRNFGRPDGLSHPEFNRMSYLKTRSGELLLGTLQGLNRIAPQKIKAALNQITPAQVYLTQIAWIDAKTGQQNTIRTNLDRLEPIQLTSDERQIELTFALSHYTKSAENVFAWKLDLPGQQWIHIGQQNQLSLANLPTGTYDLLIKGMAHRGNWSEPLRIPLQTTVFFYRQSWFYILCTLLIGAGLLFAWATPFRRQNKADQTPPPPATQHQGWLGNLDAVAQNALSEKNPLTTKYLADQMAISERQLLRRLKAETGLTVTAYIQEIKLQKARQLLESQTFDTIAEVAYACGFNTPAYFSRVFEKRFGIRPGNYS